MSYRVDRDLAVAAFDELVARPRKAGRAPHPWELPSLAAKLVLCCYLNHADNAGHCSHPGLDAVERAAGVTIRHVKRLRDELARDGWLRFTGLARLERDTGLWERRPATVAELAKGRRGWIPMASVNLPKIAAAIEAHRAWRAAEADREAAGAAWEGTDLGRAAGGQGSKSGTPFADINRVNADMDNSCPRSETANTEATVCDRGHERGYRGHLDVRQKREEDLLEEPALASRPCPRSDAPGDLLSEVAAAGPKQEGLWGADGEGVEASAPAGAARPDTADGAAALRDAAREELRWRLGPSRADAFMRSWWDGAVDWRGSHVAVPSVLHRERIEEALGRRWLEERGLGVRIEAQAARPEACGPPPGARRSRMNHARVST